MNINFLAIPRRLYRTPPYNTGQVRATPQNMNINFLAIPSPTMQKSTSPYSVNMNINFLALQYHTIQYRAPPRKAEPNKYKIPCLDIQDITKQYLTIQSQKFPSQINMISLP